MVRFAQRVRAARGMRRLLELHVSLLVLGVLHEVPRVALPPRGAAVTPHEQHEPG